MTSVFPLFINLPDTGYGSIPVIHSYYSSSLLPAPVIIGLGKHVPSAREDRELEPQQAAGHHHARKTRTRHQLQEDHVVHVHPRRAASDDVGPHDAGQRADERERSAQVGGHDEREQRRLRVTCMGG